MKEKNGEHPFGDTGQMILAGLFLISWIVDSFILRKTIFLADHVPLPIRLIVLVVALICALLLIRSSHFVVSHEKRPDYVITTGVFRYVRHPLYLASLLIYFGLATSTISLLSLTLLFAIFLFYSYIGSYEEVLLEAKFGDEYRQYRMKTGKWIPKINAQQ